jgi:hypothetical protein
VTARPDQGLLWNISAELPDLYGLRVPRVAVQALGAGWNVLLLGLAILWGKRARLFPAWLILYAAGDLGLGFLRGDLVTCCASLAAVQAADMGLMLAGLFLSMRPWR